MELPTASKRSKPGIESRVFQHRNRIVELRCQGAPQHLPALSKPGGGQLDCSLAERVSGPAVESDDNGMDARDREKHLRSNFEGDSSLGVQSSHHTRKAISGIPHPGDESLPHFFLHHHREFRQGGNESEPIQQKRGAHLVRKVGHRHPGRSAQKLVVVDAGGVGIDDPDGAVRQFLLEEGRQPAVDLDRHHHSSSRPQGAGKSPGARPHFEHSVSRFHHGRAHHTVDDVGIDEEVLS